MQLPLPSTAVRLPGNFFVSVLQFPSSRDNYTPFPDKDHHREEQEVFKLVPHCSLVFLLSFPTAPSRTRFGSLSFQGGFLNQPLVAQFQQEGGVTPSLQGPAHSTASLPCHTTTAPQHTLSNQQHLNQICDFNSNSEIKSIKQKRIKTIQLRKSRLISSV